MTQVDNHLNTARELITQYRAGSLMLADLDLLVNQLERQVKLNAELRDRVEKDAKIFTAQRAHVEALAMKVLGWGQDELSKYTTQSLLSLLHDREVMRRGSDATLQKVTRVTITDAHGHERSWEVAAS